MNNEQEKADFLTALRRLTETLGETVSTSDGQWAVKGFIDVYRSIYTISADTKIISKILEIHLFPRILSFAEELGFKIVLAKHQNYYPDLSFVKTGQQDLKFAVDIKTTYRQDNPPDSAMDLHLVHMGNTANIGSINRIEDIIAGNGMFANLGEDWFDDYWMNYGKIIVVDDMGRTHAIKDLAEYLSYRGGDPAKVVPRARRGRPGG